MATKEKLELNDKFLKQLDDIKIRVPKGYRKVIQEYAKENGLSVNELVIRLLNEHCGLDIPSGIKKLSDEERQAIREQRDKLMNQNEN
jgi:hypothetical protein